MTEDIIKKIKKDYLSGFTYKQIQKKYSITSNRLKWIIQKNKWKRKSNRGKAQKGNKNAVGNKGGSVPKENKNAVTTGEYETILYKALAEEEKALYVEYEIEDKIQELQKDFKILIIREYRIMNKIKDIQTKNKDMIIGSISKTQNNDGIETSTHATNTIDFMQKLEESLTRIQEQKRKCIDSMHKIELDNSKLELDLIRLEREVAKDEATENNDVKDNSFIKALEDSVEDVWDDYEQETNTK